MLEPYHLSRIEVSSSETSITEIQVWVRQGREDYHAGRYADAITIWQQAATTYQAQNDRLHQAQVLNYLSLAYQQLGAWTEATQTIETSLALLQADSEVISENTLEDTPDNTLDRSRILAQAFNTQGSLQFAQGQTEQALGSWQQATAYYTQMGDEQNRLGSLLNQAQAQQTLGFYGRARETLNEVERSLQNQPDSILKIIALRELGDLLRSIGDLANSQQVLQQSLTLAEQQSASEQSVIWLSLGNTARSMQDVTSALTYYQNAANRASGLTQLQAQLNQLGLLIETGQWTTAEALLPQIQTQLLQQTTSQATVFAQINFAQSLLKAWEVQGNRAWQTQDLAKLATETLITATQQAQELGDRRAESYALGYLGRVYERNQQWTEAKSLTEQALLLAQAYNASDIAYQWQWQLGRILKANGTMKDAVNAYQGAFTTLQSIRNDLVATSPDLQFSFRESVEPVYRELVDLLLRSSEPDSEQNSANHSSNLEQARSVIEALQVAELDNFFRTACLNGQIVAVDQIDQTNVAVVYPIILEDRLEVILSVPQQSLQRFTADVSREQVETTLKQFRQNLEKPFTTPEGKQLGQEIYNWLVQPLAANLNENKIETIVFILDGALRNVPMSALYDGNQYLIEQYSIALTPGLQLLNPQPLQRRRLEVLAAGLTEERFGFSALSNVAGELDQIQATIPSKTLLNQAFTSSTLQEQINASSFPVVHLATHGQFSSNAEDTFVLAWDRPIKVNELSALLRSNDETGRRAIELLVLSACETARGDARAALGLAGVAVQSGARSTLASLWSLNDESASQLISQFYHELTQTNVSKAEALRQAQLTLLHDPNYRHPLYWAPYVLLGNWL